MTKKSVRPGGRSRKSRVNPETPDLEKGKAAVKAVIQKLQVATDRFTAGADDAGAAPAVPAKSAAPSTAAMSPSPAATTIAAPARTDLAVARPIEIEIRPDAPQVAPAAESPAASVAPIAAEPVATSEVVVAPTPALPTAAAATDGRPHHDLVAREAYLIWRSRGGDAFENWILAERRVADALTAGSRTS